MLGPPLRGGPSPAAQHVPHPASSARVLTHPRARNPHRAAHAHLPARSHPRARPSSWPRQAARQAHSGPMHSGGPCSEGRAREPVWPAPCDRCAHACTLAHLLVRARILQCAHLHAHSHPHARASSCPALTPGPRSEEAPACRRTSKAPTSEAPASEMPTSEVPASEAPTS